MPEKITHAADASKFVQALIADEDREVFLVICLNAKKQIITVHRCHTDSLGANIVHPQEVFKTAIMNNAHCIIVAPKHPSVHCQCSPEGVTVCKKLIEIGEILNIEVLDSLIVSHKNGVSLKKQIYI